MATRSRPTTEGMTEARTGFINVVRPFSLKIATKAMTRGKLPTGTTIRATAPTTAAAATFVVTMVALRSQRSAKTPATGANKTSGTCHTACITAVCRVDWVSRPDHPHYGEIEEGITED